MEVYAINESDDESMMCGYILVTFFRSTTQPWCWPWKRVCCLSFPLVIKMWLWSRRSSFSSSFSVRAEADTGRLNRCSPHLETITGRRSIKHWTKTKEPPASFFLYHPCIFLSFVSVYCLFIGFQLFAFHSLLFVVSSLDLSHKILQGPTAFPSLSTSSNWRKKCFLHDHYVTFSLYFFF